MGRTNRPREIMSTNLTRKGIPHNTIRSERQSRATGNSGPRRPS